MSSGPTVPEKASALLGILLFCIQLGGAYLLPASAASSCLHTRIWLSSSPTSAGAAKAAATEEDSVVTTPAPHEDDGDSIWQCPGTADGIALTPPQPFRLAIASSGWVPQPVWHNFPEQRVLLSQGYMPARFQPPESR